MDKVFQALADPQRRTMLDIIKKAPGCNVRDVSGHFDMSRIGVMKHLRVLEDAGLVISEKSGRERKLYFNVMPIQFIYERWTDQFSALWATPLAKLKNKLETDGDY